MKSHKALPVGFLVLTLVGTSAMIATAQTAPTDTETATVDQRETRDGFREHRQGHEHGRKNGHRGHRHKHGGEMLRTLFDAADTNGDGSVSSEEIDAYRAMQISQVDTSGEGSLSIDEFDQLYRTLTRSRMVDTFQDLDADGDGQIAPEELDASIARLIDRFDRAGHGDLTVRKPGADAGSEDR